MRGRSSLVVMLAAAVLIAGGCKHQTAEEKRQRQLDKQAAAAAKAEQQRAAADAKAQAAAQKKQADLERKQAQAQAKALQKQQADEQKRQEALGREQAKQAEVQAKADKKAADAKAAQDRRQGDLSAKEQKKQADMQAKADKKAAREAAPAMAVADKTHKGTSSDYYPDDELKVIGYPYIRPENTQRLFDRHVEMMAAAGQYQDATLSDADFDGGELNATGRSNLALALKYPKADNKLTVYVNTAVAGEDLVSARMASVDRYLKSSHSADLQVTTKAGPNTNLTAPAAGGIAALKRMEKQTQGSSPTASGSDTTGGRSRMGGDTRQSQ